MLIKYEAWLQGNLQPGFFRDTINIGILCSKIDTIEKIMIKLG